MQQRRAGLDCCHRFGSSDRRHDYPHRFRSSDRAARPRAKTFVCTVARAEAGVQVSYKKKRFRGYCPGTHTTTHTTHTTHTTNGPTPSEPSVPCTRPPPIVEDGKEDGEEQGRRRRQRRFQLLPRRLLAQINKQGPSSVRGCSRACQKHAALASKRRQPQWQGSLHGSAYAYARCRGSCVDNNKTQKKT